MSDIIKTEAVVLSKIEYGDTSSIVSLYTESEGRISAIVKGVRSPGSKTGKIVDPLNHLQIIIYKKNTRDVQILTSADLISHFSRIKENLEGVKYAFSIIELIKNLTAEDEPNLRLFRGLIKILNHLDNNKENPAVLYGRFLLFFISELGYDMAIDRCSVCHKENMANEAHGFDPGLGFVCPLCLESHSGLEYIPAELFNYLFCLKNNKKVDSLTEEIINKFNLLSEGYLKHHIADFRGIHSLKIYN